MSSRNFCIVRAFVLLVANQCAIQIAVGQEHYMEIDFGLNTQETTVGGWNNFSGPAASEPINTFALIDQYGIPTGITLAPTWSAMNDDTGINGTAANFDGPYPFGVVGNGPPLPASAFKDGLYVRDGESLTLTLANLPLRTIYSFQFYGSASNSGDYSLFTVTGSSVAQDHITPLVGNNFNTALIQGIRPDSLHKITILFEGRRPDGSPQSPSINDDALGRLNYLGIGQHTLPVADYSDDGIVDSADYALWRATFGSNTNVVADGNHNGVIDAPDYVIWRKGKAAANGATSFNFTESVPEPNTSALVVMAFLIWCGFTGSRSILPSLRR